MFTHESSRECVNACARALTALQGWASNFFFGQVEVVAELLLTPTRLRLLVVCTPYVNYFFVFFTI
jgi:hypothetical protein